MVNNKQIPTEVPSYLQGIHFKAPSGCRKLRIAPNPIFIMFSLVHRYLSFHLKEARMASLWHVRIASLLWCFGAVIQ